MITKKQKELLDFIKEYYANNEIMPSYEEMMIGLGLQSKSGVFHHLLRLEERGFIKRIPNRKRAIEMVDNPIFKEEEIDETSKTKGFGTDYLNRKELITIIRMLLNA